MTKDVNELVLDAFRVEYKEQLEQLRTLVASWHLGTTMSNEPGVREAFRLAHSFKGGSRVCGLEQAERLGHDLETVLESLNKGEMPFDGDALANVTTLLDAIEDWMSAFDQDKPVTCALPEEHPSEQSTDERNSRSDRQETGDKCKQLLPVYLREQEAHLARIRQFLKDCQSLGKSVPAEELAEAARIAHTLAGAAAVVEMHAVESLASRVEHLLRAVRANQRQLDEAAQQEIADCLDKIALSVNDCEEDPGGSASSAKGEAPPDGAASHSDHGLPADYSPARAATNNPPATPVHDTVRVTVESLDRLMRSSGELLAGNQEIGRITRELAALQRDVSELEREREFVRRTASSALHRLSEVSDFDRISRYLDFVDRQVSVVATRARRLVSQQRGTAWRFSARSDRIQRDIQAARLVPAHSMFQGFRKMVRDLAKSDGKSVEFQAMGMDVRADRMVLQELKDPIMHVLRNCVSHGIERPERRHAAGKSETGRISLSLETTGGQLRITIDDDGQGVDVRRLQEQAVRRGLVSSASVSEQSMNDALTLAFAPGLSTAGEVTELAGRGMGLSIVHDAVTRLQGRVALSNRPDGGFRVFISVPLFVSTNRVLLVSIHDQIAAIPTRGIERLLRIPIDTMETIEGHPVVTYDHRPIRLVRLGEALGYSDCHSKAKSSETTSVAILKSGPRLMAVAVDAFLEERDALIANLDEFARSDQFSGGVLLEDGRVALVVQVPTVLATPYHCTETEWSAPATPAEPVTTPRLLIVDDSFTTRTLEKNILEAQGYEVSVAIDGVEALSMLRQQRFALVVTDVEMPRMDGFALLEQMKADQRLAKTPVILVTSRDRQEDQQHGLDLGADAYIIKRKFDHQELLSTIRQLL